MAVQQFSPDIKDLLAQTEEDWGNPIINRDNLVPYGIKALDLALYGIDVVNGEVVVIMGAQKNRKTTLSANILCNYMTGKKPATKPFTVIDSLESGMHPKRYRDTLIANMATRYLIAAGHRPRSSCPVCGAPKCLQLGISPEFLRYNTRTNEQQKAIDYAIQTMMTWPLYLYGASQMQGSTRNLSMAVRGKAPRWKFLVEQHNARVFIIDHVQQYSFEEGASDYEKQLRAVSEISDFVAQWGVVAMVLSQISLTSLRESRNGSGAINASGGTKLQQEANVSLSTTYVSGSGKMKIKIEESRKSASFAVEQPLEDVSGAFYGDAVKPGEGNED
jgi:hypothetical protein